MKHQILFLAVWLGIIVTFGLIYLFSDIEPDHSIIGRALALGLGWTVTYYLIRRGMSHEFRQFAIVKLFIPDAIWGGLAMASLSLLMSFLEPFYKVRN